MTAKMSGKKQGNKVADLKVDGIRITGSLQKAELFGKQFSKVSSDESIEEPFKSIKYVVELAK